MRYIGKKLAAMIITLLCISFLVYLAFDLIPGDAALAALGTDATPESLAALREQTVSGTVSGMAGSFFVWRFWHLVQVPYASRGHDRVQAANYCDNGSHFLFYDGCNFTASRYLYGKAQRQAD